MSLKDQLREAAQQAQEGLAKGAQQAQVGLAKGQAKLEQLRKERQSAGSELEALGQAYWVVQSGRATAPQLEALLDAVRPAIARSEAQTGPLPWPSIGAEETVSNPADAPPPAYPTASAPETAVPETDTAVSGPVGAPPPIPTAIHHDEPTN
jgi:hypothetical protein